MASLAVIGSRGTKVGSYLEDKLWDLGALYSGSSHASRYDHEHVLMAFLLP